MTSTPRLDTARRIAILIAASFAYSISFNWFFAQSQIGFGGVTGIAQIINARFDILPVGMLVIAMNLPLFLLGLRFLGWKHVASSLFAMLLTSVFIDLTAALWVFPPLEEPLLACLFGGAATGLTLGFIFAQDATTGGTDLAARLIKIKLAWASMGGVLLALDLFVITAYGISFQNLSGTLYGLVALFISAKAIDVVLYGLDTARIAYIISEKPAELTAAVLAELDRGVTILQGKGGYSGDDKQVLFVAFKQRQIVGVRRIVKQIDPAAFLIVCQAHEVLGEGFRSHSEDHL